MSGIEVDKKSIAEPKYDKFNPHPEYANLMRSRTKSKGSKKYMENYEKIDWRKKRIIFSDCHWGGVDPINVDQEFGDKVVYLGDNHEFKNIDKKDANRLTVKYQNFLERCEASLTKVVAGNHEVSIGRINCRWYAIQEKEVLYIHGHRLSYSMNKVDRWEFREAGRGRFGRLMSKALSKLRNVVPKNSISKKLKDEAALMAIARNCHTIVFGHTHVTEVVDVMYKGIRIINVPRGRTEIRV